MLNTQYLDNTLESQRGSRDCPPQPHSGRRRLGGH